MTCLMQYKAVNYYFHGIISDRGGFIILSYNLVWQTYRLICPNVFLSIFRTADQNHMKSIESYFIKIIKT